MTFLHRFTFALLLVMGIPLAQAQTVVRDANITFTTIDVPGAGFTGAEGINDKGDVVGFYGQTDSGPFHAFLLSQGNYTLFDYPGASSTLATGINDSRLIVGYAGDLQVLGFLFDGTSFTPIQHGNDSATFSVGINGTGMVVGGVGSVYTTQGFGFREGRFKRISPPGDYVYIYSTGVNKFGEVVGWTDYDGFVCRKGRFRTIRFPGSSMTEALGINDGGVIVGWYGMNGSVLGFALLGGQYKSFSYPGARGTLPRGINGAGQIVGEYTFDFITYHGFVTSAIKGVGFRSPLN